MPPVSVERLSRNESRPLDATKRLPPQSATELGYARGVVVAMVVAAPALHWYAVLARMPAYTLVDPPCVFQTTQLYASAV